jgi:hypothetical protein
MAGPVRQADYSRFSSDRWAIGTLILSDRDRSDMVKIFRRRNFWYN